MKAQASIWDEYARAQKRADRRMVDPNYWAADRTAENVLDLIESGVVPISEDAMRTMTRNWCRNLAATERRRKAIEANRYAPEMVESTSPSPENQIVARDALARIKATVTPGQWVLLQRAGVGDTDTEIGERLGLTPRAVEGRLARLRQRLAG